MLYTSLASLTGLLASLPLLVLSRENTSCSPNILLFTKTAGYRHDAIPYAVQVISELGSGTLTPSALDTEVAQSVWNTVNSEDETQFDNSTYLDQFDAVVFAFVTDVDPPGEGTILTDAGFANFMEYIEAGGNFVGIHSATNTLYAHPAYGRLAGAFFGYHAEAQPVSLRSTGNAHPATSQLGDDFEITEEMYHLRSNPRLLPSPAQVVLTNASAYSDPGGTAEEGDPQPLSWWRQGGLLDSNSTAIGGDLDGEATYTGGSGRSFITTLGHENATWSDGAFRGHIMGAIAWTIMSDTSRSVNASSRIGNSCANTTTSTDGSGTVSSPSPTSAALAFGWGSRQPLLIYIMAGLLPLGVGVLCMM